MKLSKPTKRNFTARPPKRKLDGVETANRHEYSGVYNSGLFQNWGQTGFFIGDVTETFGDLT
jgi:hypothetical protein